MGGPFQKINSIDDELFDATDNAANKNMQKTVDNANTSRMKTSGTGNTFRAILSADGSGYTPLDDAYRTKAGRGNMTPVFSGEGGSGKGGAYQKGDLSAKAQAEKAEADRKSSLASMSRKDRNKAWRSGEMDEATWRESKALAKQKKLTEKENRKNQSGIHYDSSTDKGIADRYQDYSKKSQKQFAKESKKQDKQNMKAMKHYESARGLAERIMPDASNKELRQKTRSIKRQRKNYAKAHKNT
tara:strand:- start:48702 stop:49430 length:729 start_codon:yes stop_codon:yes gene_type:complete